MKNRFIAILILIVTLLPVANVFYSISIASQLITNKELFDYHQSLTFLQIVLVATLVIIYLCFTYKLNSVPKSKKTMWAFIIFFFNIFTMPVFWYLFIWKTPEAADKSIAPN
ncbi:MAG: hypothetical protein HWE16_04700 [Gammaproteobacteria bacterium]|nr:hypothetical protein [Gammaproteobacteria bacterium]